METFFFKYRKFLIAISILLLIYSPFEIYRGITIIQSDGTYQGEGTLLNAAVTYIIVPIYILVSVNKAYKKYKKENPH